MIEHSEAAMDGYGKLPARAGEVEFRRLLEKLPAGAYTCDPQGQITYYNQHAVGLWGRAPKLNDPVDRFCGSFRLFAATDGSLIRHDQCWMAQALATNSEYNAREVIVERPDGQKKTVLAYANPIRDDAGKLIGAVNVLVDITDRKQAENQLREADRCKDEFLATLAHELRNPLAPIRNAVELLQLRDSVDPDAHWAIEVIDRQSRQLTRLIDDLLDVSRITRNKLELRRQRVELAEIVKAAVETSRPLIESAGHQLTVNVPTDPIWLNADPTRLGQAISNLLNNAAKYTAPGGRVWLTTEREGSDAIITVRDTGVGIAADMLPRVFDMFAQADPDAERSRGGLGIGLTLVKRLAELHGGSVEARSGGLGKGSEFAIRLPVLVEPLAASASGHPRFKVATGLACRKILVADDNADALRSLEILLRITGNEIRTARDGVEAIGVAGEFRPDIVLLDIGMPRMNGYEAARHIRQQPWGRLTTLIAITGWGQDGDKQRSSDAGFDQHLVKPVDPAMLMQLLNSPTHTAPAQ
jgi:signal transduction histidine kinase/ActR/RegA family two-component response regulator